MSRERLIPDKMYFRIGEVADILEVKPYVLRYWETEFPDIKPVKSQSNQRLYKRRDVELLQAIKRLLYDEKFTINGARQHLKELMRQQPRDTSDDDTPIDDALIEAPASAAAKAEPVKVAQSKTGDDSLKKILAKLKSDIGWCLAELRK